MSTRNRRLSLLVIVLSTILWPGTSVANGHKDEQLSLPRHIVLAADPWCPHNCEAGSNREGYMVDIARQAFALQGITVRYVNMSWARALQEARNNHIDGILGAFKGDAEDFVFPEKSLGLSETVFFTHQSSNWVYNGLPSLENLTLLTIADYFYAPDINAYINEHRWNPNRILELSGEQPLPRALALIRDKRAQLLLEDSQVMAWALRNGSHSPAVRRAGRVYVAPVYAAFAPSHPYAEELAQILSEGVRQLRTSGELTRIYQNYGLDGDWKARMVSPSGELNSNSP